MPASYEDVMTTLRQADASGNADDARRLAQIASRLKPAVSEPAPESAAVKPETTAAGLAKEVGKGVLRGPSDVAMMAGKGGTQMLLGPVLGPLAARGIDVLSAP